MSHNLIIVQGNLGSDPEDRTKGDLAICQLSVATNRRGKQKDVTDWHRITVFGRLAETCLQYLGKGRSVLVQGRLQYSTYEKDGVKIRAAEIVADEVQFLGGGDRQDQGQQRGGYNQGGGNNYRNQGQQRGFDSGPRMDSENIPF